MKFIKLKQKNGVNTVTLKLNRYENFNQDELRKILNLNGFLKPQTYTKNKMLFVFPACSSVKSILANGIDRFNFFKIILRIADAFYALVQLHIAICKLDLNTENIFYDGNEIYIIYNPTALVTTSNEQCINAFFQTICSQAVLLNSDNSNILFNNFLNLKKSLDFTEYLNFIEQNCPGLVNSIGNLNFNHIDFETLNAQNQNFVPQNNYYENCVYNVNRQNSQIIDEGATVPLNSDYENWDQLNGYQNLKPEGNSQPSKTDISNLHQQDDLCFPASESPCGFSLDKSAADFNNFSLEETVPLDDYNCCNAQNQQCSAGDENTPELYDMHNSMSFAGQEKKNIDMLINNQHENRMNCEFGLRNENRFNSGNTVVLTPNSNSHRPVKTLNMKFVKTGEIITISKPEFHIGSDPTCCDFSVHNPGVSKMHITVFEKNGEFYVRDNGSTNGTSINGKNLVSGQPQKLHSYDRILMADEIIDIQITEG